MRWPILTVALMAFLGSGCDRSRDTQPTLSSNQTEPAPQTQEPHLDAARRLLRLGDLEGAVDAATKALVQDPGNAEAAMVACEAEAARGNHASALELAQSIDIQSRWAARAIEMQSEQLFKLGRTSEAAEVLVAGLRTTPNRWQWRHRLWLLFNRVGRRQEASRQAEILCRAGEASEPELLSLLRRNESFPVQPSDTGGQRFFEPELGLARWHFTHRRYHQALDELSEQSDSGFQTAAACALYGRLLAETQAWELISAWHGKCNREVQEHNDYWAALGTYFFDQHQFEASARALLEAMQRDPTDDVTAHRLAKVFAALGRTDDSEEFRQRAVAIAQTEQDAELLSESPSEFAVRALLPQKMLELGRPFEALAWSLTLLPNGASEKRAEIERKRIELSRNDRALVMAAESSLIGIDPQQFDLEPAYRQLQGSPPATLAPSLPHNEPLATPRLVNRAVELGLSFQWYKDVENDFSSIPIHEMMGGGIGIIDYDLDGWPDVYLGQGSGDPPTDASTRSSELMRNEATQFRAVTSTAGAEDRHYSTGIAVGDVNQDGFPDLFLGSLGKNRLLINAGDGTFRDASGRMGDVVDRFTSSLAIADISGDALPDLFEAVYIEMEDGFRLPDVGPDGKEMQPSPLKHYAQSDRWLKNMGSGRFEVHEISTEVAEPGTSLGLLVTDFDGDHRNEVFVANDGRPNHFLIPAGDGQFRNAAAVKGLANGFSGEAYACMGIAHGDFDRNGTLDLSVTNFLKEPSNLYLQSPSGGFTDLAARFRLDALSVPYIGFGTKAIDIDRDGRLDLIVANGHVFDMTHRGESFRMPPQMLMGHGDRFEEVLVDDDSGYWSQRYLGRCVALTDFDRDGSIDAVVGHLDQPIALLHNQTAIPRQTQTASPGQTAEQRQSPTNGTAAVTGHWIQFELIGTTSERDAIGARIEVVTGGERWTQWVAAGDGYLCSDEAVVDFGIGSNRRIDRVEVTWPSGNRQMIESPASDRRYLVVEGQPQDDIHRLPSPRRFDQ